MKNILLIILIVLFNSCNNKSQRDYQTDYVKLSKYIKIPLNYIDGKTLQWAICSPGDDAPIPNPESILLITFKLSANGLESVNGIKNIKTSAKYTLFSKKWQNESLINSLITSEEKTITKIFFDNTKQGMFIITKNNYACIVITNY